MCDATEGSFLFNCRANKNYLIHFVTNKKFQTILKNKPRIKRGLCVCSPKPTVLIFDYKPLQETHNLPLV